MSKLDSAEIITSPGCVSPQKKRLKARWWAAFCLMVFFLGGVSVYQFTQFESKLSKLSKYRDDIKSHYLELELLRLHHSTFKANATELKRDLKEVRPSDEKGSDMAALASLGEAIKEGPKVAELKLHPLNPFSWVFAPIVADLEQDIFTYRKALAENYDIQMEWDRFRAMQALKGHFEKERKKRL